MKKGDLTTLESLARYFEGSEEFGSASLIRRAARYIERRMEADAKAYLKKHGKKIIKDTVTLDR